MQDFLTQLADPSTLAYKLLFLAVAVAIAYVVQRLLVKLVRRGLDAAGLPKTSIVVNVVRFLVWWLALIAVLKPVFGVEPTAFVGALGIVSVALSLGLQDTISNLFGGFMITVGKVIQIGDDVSVGGFSGKVVDTTWRNTLLRDRYGTVQVVPNSVINSSALTRVNRSDATLGSVPVVVTPTADLDAVTEEVERAVEQALGERLEPGMATRVYFSEMAEKGYVGKVCYHVRDDVSLTAAADDVVRALAHRPWLARLSLPSDPPQG